MRTFWNNQERPLYIAVFLYISYYILRFRGVTSALKSLGSDTVSVQVRSQAPSKREKINKFSPVLLSLGSDWKVKICHFCLKSGVFIKFVCISQFIVYFVNFLQQILLRVVCIASVNAACLYCGVIFVACPFHYYFLIDAGFLILRTKRNVR